MADIWRTRDRAGREVTLTTAAWAHILAQHAEMAGRQADVRAAVEAPGLVVRDPQYSRRKRCYRRTPSGRRWLKVVINYAPVPPQGTWAGEIVTAHFVREPDPKEEQLWP